ncbi:MAG: tetratricopeptide repeat protein [Nitrospirae bacterium]|nr:tetratricopeptide repeat protein [Nitrospirota bacterium]
MTEWRVLVYYFSLLAYPIPDRLSIDYFVPISRNLFQPLSTFFSLILIVASISWSIKNAKKFPFISFGILWFFINLLVESTFIPIDLVFEHRLYLPSIGIFISSVSGISYLFRRWPYPILKGMGMVLFLISLLFESVFTIERNKDWFSQIALWASAVKRSPDSFRAHINLGKAYEDENDLDLAEKEYVRTLELNPNEVLAHNDYGSVLLKKGEIRKAESEFMTAISLNQNLFIARYNLANLHGQLLGPEIGIKETKELLNQFPKLVQGYLYLGELYESSSNPDEARQAYLEANQINPDALEPLNHLGVLCLKLGDYKNAEIYFKEALMVDPNPSQLHQNLGRTYQFQGLPKKALEEYILAYEGNPRNTAIHFNIGSLFLQNGNFETAVAEFEKGAADKATRESLPLLKEALTIIHDPELRTKIENLINKISN